MLTTTHLVGFDWLNSANAASATATATSTATGPAAGISVTNVGTNAANPNGSTITFTVPSGGIPANSVIIVAVGQKGLNTLLSVSDTKSNTYQLGVQRTGTGLPSLGALAYSQNAAALVSGDIITATYSASSPSRNIIVAYATGLTTGTLIDKNSKAAGSSSSPSSGATASTTVAAELAIGIVVPESSVTVTEASGYTQISESTTGSNIKVHLAYRILSSTGAQTYSPSLSGSVQWVCAVETLKT